MGPTRFLRPLVLASLLGSVTSSLMGELEDEFVEA